MGKPSIQAQDEELLIVDFPTTGYDWYTSTFDYGAKNWVLTGTGLGVNVFYPSVNLLPKLILRNATETVFKKSRTYQFITQVGSFSSPGGSFSLTTAWGSHVDYDDTNVFELNSLMTPPYPGNGYLFYYSTPPIDTSTKDFITYKANYSWGLLGNSEALYESRINEIDFDIQGFAWWKDSNSGTQSGAISFSASTDGLGWSYYADTNSYVWYDDITVTQPIKAAMKYEYNNQISYAATSSSSNYLMRYIELSTFNLSFTYTKLTTDDSGIDIYLSQEKPGENYFIVFSEQSIPNTAQLIASYTGSSTFSYYFGLTGKQYLIIRATNTSSKSILALSNILISGGYWPGNNRRYISTNSNLYYNPTSIIPIGLTGATFSTFVGTGNTYNATQSLDVQQIFSKIGNGKFKSGIWENGVWNSGWRFDEEVYELYEIGQYFTYNKSQIWRFQIIGPPSVVSNFQTGDNISIGNIVAIDFNENRKLLKGYFTILFKNENSIIVELINNFPLKRIERDSSYHRIKITKNIWLSGVFLNGYYTGVWNSGLFKGYPLLTEMYDSNWIDGTFDGGHFSSRVYSVTFSNTYFVKGGKVGLLFSQPHKLNTNDSILIDKDDKTLNPTYDGTSSVISIVDEYTLVIDKTFNSIGTGSESGTIYTEISSGVVQNFTFKSNNISELSSVDFLDSDAVFLYNSWLDVSYYTYSAVNIGRPQTLRNNISLKEYSSNNLYGYPTDDVLSSISTFRNSYNNQQISYSLGNKYKIFNDYVGESSKFEKYFLPTNVNPSRFLELGWTYAEAGVGSIIFSRSQETKAKNRKRPGFSYDWNNVSEDLLVGTELQIDAISSGGVLNLVEPTELTNFRRSEQVERARYTMVEFNLARWSANSTEYVFNDSLQIGAPPKFPTKYKEDNISQPILHFDNLNTVTRDIFYGDIIGTYSTTVEATFFPIYKNINHLSTPVSKKIEYFYNKTNLSMNVRGSGWYGSTTASVLIDDLKYYEVDMIPFFQYFTKENINFGIVVPYQGIAPFIDYSNANFQFLDNVAIGFDSFSVNSSNVAVSGVGAGIGLAGYGGGGRNPGIGDIMSDDNQVSNVFD